MGGTRSDFAKIKHQIEMQQNQHKHELEMQDRQHRHDREMQEQKLQDNLLWNLLAIKAMKEGTETQDIITALTLVMDIRSAWKVDGLNINPEGI